MRIRIKLFVFIFILGVSAVNAQNKVKPVLIDITSRVINENGIPVVAKIYANEGSIEVKTKSDGSFIIKTERNSQLLIEANGYIARKVNANDIEKEIVLTASTFMFSDNDKVQIAFGERKLGELNATITKLSPNEILKFDNSQSVASLISGRVSGMFNANNLRGLGNALVIVDGIPRYSITSDVIMSTEEIAQISILKDAAAVLLYGSQARNGVIIIKTKRGQANKRVFNVNAFTGISMPKALPNYLNSSDYMEYYNQARVNDGLEAKYSESYIQKYKNGNKYRYPSNDFYSSDYLKPFKTFSKVITEFAGGNDNTTFYANLGFSTDGDLLNFGQAKNYKENRINARANVDFKINDFIKSNIDIAGVIDYNVVSSRNYYSAVDSIKPFEYAMLLPIALMQKGNPDLIKLLDARKNDVDGIYLLGGTQQYRNSIIADIYAGGSSQRINRSVQFSNGIDIDLRKLLKGLVFKSNLSFDFNNSYNQSIRNTYSIYEPVWSIVYDSIGGLNQYGLDSKPGTQAAQKPDFLRRIGVSAQFDYKRAFAQNHNIDATVLGLTNTVMQKGTLQPQKYNNLGFRLNYMYDKKYNAELSGSLLASGKLPVENRTAFSPAISLGWIISNENFLSDNKFIDFLKLSTSYASLNSDMNLADYYLYESVYKTQGSYIWADGAFDNSAISSLRGQTAKLGYEKRNEFNIGIDGYFFNKALSCNLNYFNTLISDIYTTPKTLYPSFYTDFIPHSNYDKNLYQGFELNVNYKKSLGNWSIDLNLSGMLWNSKIMQKDEQYSESYLYAKGKPVDSQFGLIAEGLFTDQNEINNHSYQTFGEVKPGDIKYKDVNNDGYIDSDDLLKIGRNNPQTLSNLSILLGYKGFSLFVLCRAELGADSYLSGSYYRPDGDVKYSEIAKESWTEETKLTAKYPRLSSKLNSNNNRNSTFWQYSADYFSINRIQFNYSLPESVLHKLFIKELNFFVSGNDILLLSHNNRAKELNIGMEPQFRSFTVGLRSKF